MKILNLNQKKLILEGLVNLSVSFVSIGFINPIIAKSRVDSHVLITIILLVILAFVMILYSIKLLK